MSLIHKMITAEVKVLDAVECDKCGKRIESCHDAHWNEFGTPYSNFFAPRFQEDFFVTKIQWGYRSNKDTEAHELVLCEPCYDEVFKGVKIKVTHYM